jgi:hypothetical protein
MLNGLFPPHKAAHFPDKFKRLSRSADENLPITAYNTLVKNKKTEI